MAYICFRSLLGLTIGGVCIFIHLSMASFNLFVFYNGCYFSWLLVERCIREGTYLHNHTKEVLAVYV